MNVQIRQDGLIVTAPPGYKHLEGQNIMTVLGINPVEEAIKAAMALTNTQTVELLDTDGEIIKAIQNQQIN